MNQVTEISKRKQMQMMREAGSKCKEIAEAFGVSKQYVSQVCGKGNPKYFQIVGDDCPYPNLRNWMNENKVSKMELLRRIGLASVPSNYERLCSYINGKTFPRKPYIDKMLKVTGLTYEELFYTDVKDA